MSHFFKWKAADRWSHCDKLCKGQQIYLDSEMQQNVMMAGSIWLDEGVCLTDKLCKGQLILLSLIFLRRLLVDNGVMSGWGWEGFQKFTNVDIKSDLQGESNLDQFAWGWRPVARWILSIFIAIIIKIFIIIFHHLQLSPSSSFNICHHIVILGGRGGHNPIIINVITKFIIYNDHHHYLFCNQSSFCD